MIAVVDYGAGNLHSVRNTLDSLGAGYTLVRMAEEILRADKIILPGVGHFGQMMRALDESGVRDALVKRIRAGVPFLGICLGMQALFESSAEAPEARGLGILEGTVERFPAELRVPHMGWNRVTVRAGSRLFGNVAGEPWFYFAHSYYVAESPARAAACTYSVTYTAAVEQGSVFGVQFHPEKSAAAGQSLVKGFLEL